MADIESLPIEELKDLKAAIESAITMQERQRKAAALEALEATARKLGYKMSDLTARSNKGRGFASMSWERRREVASQGAKASSGNFAKDPERAIEQGRKGGTASGGNFRNDPERASAEGKKGGRARKRPQGLTPKSTTP